MTVGVGLRALVLAVPANAAGAGGGPASAGGPGEVLAVVREGLARRPRATLGLFAVMAVMAVVQYLVPSVIGDLMRRPDALSDGQWWRAVTALLVQCSGIGQIAFNLSALLVIGAVAEEVLGRWRTSPQQPPAPPRKAGRHPHRPDTSASLRGEHRGDQFPAAAHAEPGEHRRQVLLHGVSGDV